MNPSLRVSVLAPLSAAILLSVSRVPAGDLHVRRSGGTGFYKDIQSAVRAARIGDRILVHPGIYPSFSIDRSVTILALGSAPGQVRVGAIRFHPVHPQRGYEVRLSGFRVLPPSTGTQVVLSGAELGGGSLELESMILDGGVSLGVGKGESFRLTIDNSRIRGDRPGAGDRGATLRLEGDGVVACMHRSRIEASPGSLSPYRPPMAGLALEGGAVLRMDQSLLVGGNGAKGQPGGPGLEVRVGKVESIHGATTILGGTGGFLAAGGPAIRSDSPVRVGSAVLRGGAGNPRGPVLQGKGMIYRLDPAFPSLHVVVDGNGSGPVLARGGSVIEWRLGSSDPSAFLLTTNRMRRKGNPFDPLLFLDPWSPFFWVHSSTKIRVPKIPAVTKGIFLHTQGIAYHPRSRSFLASPPSTVRIDG